MPRRLEQGPRTEARCATNDIRADHRLCYQLGTVRGSIDVPFDISVENEVIILADQ